MSAAKEILKLAPLGHSIKLAAMNIKAAKKKKKKGKAKGFIKGGIRTIIGAEFIKAESDLIGSLD